MMTRIAALSLARPETTPTLPKREFPVCRCRNSGIGAGRVAGVLTLAALESARGMTPTQYARLRAAAVCEFGDTLGYVSRTADTAAPATVPFAPVDGDSWDDPRWDTERWTISDAA